MVGNTLPLFYISSNFTVNDSSYKCARKYFPSQYTRHFTPQKSSVLPEVTNISRFFYYELGGVYLFIIFPNCAGVNESMKSSAGDAIPLPYILQPHRIQGVIGTYPGHSSLPSCPCSPCSSSPSNPDLAQHAQPVTCSGRFTPKVN